MDLTEPSPASRAWSDVRTWRVGTRLALINERLSCGREVRQQRGERAKQRLIESLDFDRYPTLGVYSPMRGEVDILGLAADLAERGSRLALPVVVEKASPVEFWHWWPGAPMSLGLWNIPIPANRERVEPDALIVPLVGFDPKLFRLGYGGGYYDRTLARAARRPYCVGFGYEVGKLPSIFPQAHDIPMDLIVTDEKVYAPLAQT